MLLNSSSVLAGDHGAGMENEVFLPVGSSFSSLTNFELTCLDSN